uniref:Uncharacterized protein n=1 Tax=Candidatus Kentrum eta TaxID=2126337 RepID=A0A450USJ2_9GAMM|nr:MAG: hypothetical protein BECKH772A_GA0070896_1000145 [Candidatus Kentron sp. H]VFJ88267.1 MAG: hypothetical protein BECKH772B_GA0070898_1000137 [Candidatus Kentron sp. H]VFJ95489.1 MAG: hypothetical protein BECKH772C_GA0070978_1000245 [Candidatus Kentron sp. H]
MWNRHPREAPEAHGGAIVVYPSPIRSHREAMADKISYRATHQSDMAEGRFDNADRQSTMAKVKIYQADNIISISDR